jgi:hypothetical protein
VQTETVDGVEVVREAELVEVEEVIGMEDVKVDDDTAEVDETVEVDKTEDVVGTEVVEVVGAEVEIDTDELGELVAEELNVAVTRQEQAELTALGLPPQFSR